jgi:hypothetical protein
MSEHVLGFGCALSSGIAQRVTHLVRQIVTERMIALDEPFVTELLKNAGKHMRAWFTRRDAVTATTCGQQALLFQVSIYTDDSNKGAVCCARMIHLITMWTDVCAELGVLCADPHERGLGSCPR